MVIVLTPAAVSHVEVFGEATGSIGETVVHNTRGDVTCTWTSTGTPLPEGADLSPKFDLKAGQYRLVVTDEQQQTASITYTVTQNRPLVIYPARVRHVDVYGQSTGSIERTVVSGGSGVYTPYWFSTVKDVSQDHSLQAKTDLPAGAYRIRVVDGVGASDEYTYEVRQSQELSIRKGAVRNATLHGRTGGFIASGKILGGIPPYELAWTRQQGGVEVNIDVPMMAANATILTTKRELRPGLYTLTVTDSMQASATAAYRVKEGPDKQYFEFASTRNFYRKSD